MFVREAETWVVVPKTLNILRRRLRAEGFGLPDNATLYQNLHAHGWLIGAPDRPVWELRVPRSRSNQPARLGVLRLHNPVLWAAKPPKPFTEVYLALETGTVDGQENPLNIIRSNRFQEVQKHLSFTDHAYTVSIVSMNLPKFQSLTPEQQQAILDAAQEAATYQRDLNRQQASQDLATIKEAGVEVVEEVDKDAFKSVVYEPVKATYVEQFGPDLVDAIEKQR